MEPWLLIACVAPALWAISNLVDVYFVDSVYEDEYDGAIISGLFQLLPWGVVVFGLWDFNFHAEGASFLFLAGMLFLFALFFYFRALFSENDAALAQLLWNLTAPLILLLGWVAYDEVLTRNQYIGMALVLMGACFLGFRKSFRKRDLLVLIKPMSLAILLLAVSMLLADRGYTQNTGAFFDNYLMYALGNVCAALLLFGVNFSESGRRLRRIGSLSRRYFLIFFAAEFVAFVGYIFSQLAIDLSPSAALVAAIESLIPVFVIMFSLLLVLILRFFHRIPDTTQQLYRDQTDGYVAKIIASLIIAVGIYFLS